MQSLANKVKLYSNIAYLMYIDGIMYVQNNT